MIDWGAHYNDIVFWVFDCDGFGLVSVEGKLFVEMIFGGYIVVSEYVVMYMYVGGVVYECCSIMVSEWYGGVKDCGG